MGSGAVIWLAISVGVVVLFVVTFLQRRRGRARRVTTRRPLALRTLHDVDAVVQPPRRCPLVGRGRRVRGSRRRRPVGRPGGEQR